MSKLPLEGIIVLDFATILADAITLRIIHFAPTSALLTGRNLIENCQTDIWAYGTTEKFFFRKHRD